MQAKCSFPHRQDELNIVAAMQNSNSIILNQQNRKLFVCLTKASLLSVIFHSWQPCGNNIIVMALCVLIWN